MSDYINERNKKSIKSLSNYLTKLPDYCYNYFIGIENNSSALTRQNYAQDLCVFFDYLSKYKLCKPIKQIDFNDLNNLKAIDIEAFLSYLSYYVYNGKNFSNYEKGKARKLSTIRSFFKYNYKCDNLKSNVTTKIDTPKIHTKQIIRLEVDEVAKLINEADCPTNLTNRERAYNKHTRTRDVAILSLFLTTGIRVSECVGINIKDVDLDNCAFKVTRKGGNQVVLYFSDETKQALSDWLKDRQIFMKNENEDALFVSLQKKRITTRAVENLVKKYSLAISPLKKISPHKLRSTYGTNLYKETGDIYVVAEVLGHKDVNTTKKHYAAMSEDIKRAAANKVKLRG